MTTVAFDGKFLAADSLTVCDQTITETTRKKIHKVSGGYVAGCGVLASVCAFVDWVRVGMPDDTRPNLDDNFLAVIWDGKNLRVWDEKYNSYTVDAPYAIGSGAAIALSAMRLGLSARQAVKHAIDMDIYSGGKVQFAKLK